MRSVADKSTTALRSLAGLPKKYRCQLTSPTGDSLEDWVNTYTDAGSYRVLINSEAQYSLWPLGKTIPVGWCETGTQGTEEACMKFVDAMWKDMRPASLQRQMLSVR
jgi:MbtH protein